MIQALANTMLITIFIGFAMVGMNRALQRLMERNFARIAAAEAQHLDEQLRGLTDY